MDTDSEIAFPTLASAAPTNSAVTNSAWSSAAGPRIKATAVAKAPVFADSFTLSAIDLSNSGKDGKPATLGEVIKQVIAKYKVKVEASANQKARQTTFHVKAESQKELDKAKRSLLALLSPVVSSSGPLPFRRVVLTCSFPKITLVINAPVSTIASIIGPKGATLKQIRDQTSVRVDIPKRESSPTGNGHANGAANGNANHDDDEEEPTVPVTLTGPQPLAYEAQALLNQIISSKTSKTTQRVRDIPAHILPFVLVRKANFLSAAQDGVVNLSLNAPAREISASGDREAVVRVVEYIKKTIEALESGLTSIKMSIPRFKHRLLTGQNADAIMAKSNCAVVVGKDTDEVTIWGQAANLSNGLSAVIEQSNSQHIHDLALPGPIAFSKQIANYLNRVQYAKILKTSHPAVEVFLPSANSDASTLSIDLVGNKPEVDAAVKQISELLGKLNGATKDVTVDWLLHRVINGKNGKKYVVQFYHRLSVS